MDKLEHDTQNGNLKKHWECEKWEKRSVRTCSNGCWLRSKRMEEASADCSRRWKLRLSAAVIHPTFCHQSPAKARQKCQWSNWEWWSGLCIGLGGVNMLHKEVREVGSGCGQLSADVLCLDCMSVCVCVRVCSCWSEVPQWWMECWLLQRVQPSDAFIVAHVPNLRTKRSTEKETLLCCCTATRIQAYKTKKSWKHLSRQKF